MKQRKCNFQIFIIISIFTIISSYFTSVYASESVQTCESETEAIETTDIETTDIETTEVVVQQENVDALPSDFTISNGAAGEYLMLRDSFVKESPDNSSETIAMIPKERNVYVIKTGIDINGNEWGNITIAGADGWIMMADCKSKTDEQANVQKDKTENAEDSEHQGGSTKNYLVTAGVLNVRSGPSVNYPVFSTVNRNTQLTVSEISENNWGKIDVNGSIGWVSLDYCTEIATNVDGDSTTTEENKTTSTEPMVTNTTESSTVTTTENSSVTTEGSSVITETSNITTQEDTKKENMYQVKADALNVRAGAGTGYSILGVISNASKWQVSKITEDDWGRISFNGIEGWISLTYCTKIEETDTTIAATGETTDKGEKKEEETDNDTDEANWQVTASGLNIRSGPSSAYDKIGMLENGEKITVEKMLENGWGKIKWNNKEGYIFLDYCEKLTENSDADEAENTDKTSQTAGNYKVTASGLYVRTGPGTSFKWIRILSSGTIVSISEISDANWGYLNSDDGKGWICLDYCEKFEE